MRVEDQFDNGATLSPWSDWVAMSPFGGAPSLDSVNYSNDGATLCRWRHCPRLTVTSYGTSCHGMATRPSTEATLGTWPNSYGNTGATSSPYTDPNGSAYCPVGTSCSWRRIRADIGTGRITVGLVRFGGRGHFRRCPLTRRTVNYSNDGATLFFTVLRHCPPAWLPP